MFIVDLHYIQELSAVDHWVAEHRAFLEKYYASGQFLMSGRKVPRTGGIILVRASSLAQVEAIIQEDPFHREGIARYTITEFVPSMTADTLAMWQEFA